MIMKIKPGQQKKNLVIKTKKKVIKTAGRKKPKIAKMPHSFPKKKKGDHTTISEDIAWK